MYKSLLTLALVALVGGGVYWYLAPGSRQEVNAERPVVASLDTIITPEQKQNPPAR